ncbi:MAG: hypothetical protein QXD27_02930 [Metallosphaera sp.]
MKNGSVKQLIVLLLMFNALAMMIVSVNASVSAQPTGQATAYTSPYTATNFILNTTVNPINTIAIFVCLLRKE